MLLANKPTIVRQAAATAGPEEEKIKKFATAIVEFSKVKKTERKVLSELAWSHRRLSCGGRGERERETRLGKFHTDDVTLPRSV